MKKANSDYLRIAFALVTIVVGAAMARAQIGAATRSSSTTTVFHVIEGRIRQRNKSADNIRVRLVRVPQMQPIAETFTRQEGQFLFQRVPSGEYLVETFETEMYEAT